MGGFLQPVSDAFQNMMQRQNYIRGIGMQQAGETQRQQAAIQNQQQMNYIDAWDAQRQHMADRIAQTRSAYPEDLNLQSQLNDVENRLASERRPQLGDNITNYDPGRTFDKYAQELHDAEFHAQNARQAKQTVNQALTTPIPTGPGAAPPGQVSGQPPVLPPLAGVGGPRSLNIPANPFGISPMGASMIASSPVQQGGGGTAPRFPDTTSTAGATQPIQSVTGTVTSPSSSAQAPPSGGGPGSNPYWAQYQTIMNQIAQPYFPADRRAELLQRANSLQRAALTWDSPEFQAMTPFAKGLIMSEIVGGIQAPAGLANMTRPMRLGSNALPASQLPDSAVDIGGAPINKAGGGWFIPYLDRTTGETIYSQTQPQTHQVMLPDPSSKTGFSLVTLDPLQQEYGRRSDATPPPGFTPEFQIRNGIMQVRQPDGSIAAVPFTSKEESYRSLPGFQGSDGSKGIQPVTAPNAPAPATSTPSPASKAPPGGGPGAASAGPPGRIIGGESITPNERVGWESKLRATNNTISLMRDIQRNLPIVQNMLQAKKIMLSIDPDRGLIVQRTAGALLNDEEAKLAADFEGMHEHINTLRQPLGATGFRSEDSWNALQGMIGSLNQNPRIAQGVITNTIQALNGQYTAIARGLKGERGFPMDLPSVQPPAAQIQPAPGGITKAPNVGSVESGYRFKGGDPSKQENWEKVK